MLELVKWLPMPVESRPQELVKDEMLNNDLTCPGSCELETKMEGNSRFSVMVLTFDIGRCVDASFCPSWFLNV